MTSRFEFFTGRGYEGTFALEKGRFYGSARRIDAGTIPLGAFARRFAHLKRAKTSNDGMESENRTFCTQSLAFKHSNNSSLSPLHAIRVLRDDFFVDITRDTPPDFLEAMRFNQKELFLYGLDCAGDADKEGVLSLREKDKLFRRPSKLHAFSFDSPSNERP